MDIEGGGVDDITATAVNWRTKRNIRMYKALFYFRGCKMI